MISLLVIVYKLFICVFIEAMDELDDRFKHVKIDDVQEAQIDEKPQIEIEIEIEIETEIENETQIETQNKTIKLVDLFPELLRMIFEYMSKEEKMELSKQVIREDCTWCTSSVNTSGVNWSNCYIGCI